MRLSKFPFLSRRQLLLGSGTLALSLGAPAAFAPAWSETGGVPKKGGTITFLVDPEPPTLVPAVNSSGPSRQVGSKIHEGLLEYDFDLTPRPQLATSWSISPDGLEYTFKLRPGVKWHDGKDFTSADVEFSIGFLKKNHTNGRNTFANVAEIRTPDPLTAVIVLSKPAPYLITALAAHESPIIAKHVYEGQEALTAPANNAPVGTGPFVFKEWVRGSHIILERNPNYWDAPKPHIDRLVVRFIRDPAARAVALETGDVDLAADTPVPLSELERFKALPNIGLETRGYSYIGDINQIIFNLDNPYLKNVLVRRAFAHAINKQVVLDLIWYGYGQIANGPIVPSLKPFHANDLPVYAFDPKKAEALLDQAGFPRGANGVRFKLTNDFLPYTENFRRGSEYLRQALGKVGIEVTIRVSRPISSGSTPIGISTSPMRGCRITTTPRPGWRGCSGRRISNSACRSPTARIIPIRRSIGCWRPRPSRSIAKSACSTSMIFSTSRCANCRISNWSRSRTSRSTTRRSRTTQ
jgi:peptide/nickel transport system substrate-binding protein